MCTSCQHCDYPSEEFASLSVQEPVSPRLAKGYSPEGDWPALFHLSLSLFLFLIVCLLHLQWCVFIIIIIIIIIIIMRTWSRQSGGAPSGLGLYLTSKHSPGSLRSWCRRVSRVPRSIEREALNVVQELYKLSAHNCSKVTAPVSCSHVFQQTIHQ